MFRRDKYVTNYLKEKIFRFALDIIKKGNEKETEREKESSWCAHCIYYESRYYDGT